MIELKLRDAPIKPDKILKSIASRFGFMLGVPEHIFDENKKFQQTDTLIFYKGRDYKASVSLKISEFNDAPCYHYRYEGPVIKNKNFKPKEIYQAHVLYGASGCFSCGGMRQSIQTIRDEKTPEWFPIED